MSNEIPNHDDTAEARYNKAEREEEERHYQSLRETNERILTIKFIAMMLTIMLAAWKERYSEESDGGE